MAGQSLWFGLCGAGVVSAKKKRILGFEFDMIFNGQQVKAIFIHISDFSRRHKSPIVTRHVI
jgi:hypothetical protein